MNASSVCVDVAAAAEPAVSTSVAFDSACSTGAASLAVATTAAKASVCGFTVPDCLAVAADALTSAELIAVAAFASVDTGADGGCGAGVFGAHMASISAAILA